MWWNLLKHKWSSVLTLIPKPIPRIGRLCLSHISTQWKICKPLLHHHGYRLPRNTIRLHWAAGWQNRWITAYGKIMWKCHLCPCLHANQSKPLEDQVKEGRNCTKNELCNFFLQSSFTDSFPTPLRVEWDSSLNMNHQIWLHKWYIGLESLENVGAHSHFHLAPSLHHPTQGITQTMQTASTPSLSPLALPFTYL